ncbi:MAG TPA: hydantoinase/oxoprolinase family protein [Candidatus Dormibacteraeota bacterium]
MGGTFTDLILVDDGSGEFTVAKALTTPDDPARAVATALEDALGRAGVAAGQVAQIVHGTTLVTNAIIERKGARTALLATAGFRDALEIGKEARFELYDIELELPEPLVPRYLRFDVPQRTLSDGETAQELDAGLVERLARELAEAGVEAVAIAFLHSYANPEPERTAREAVLRAAPEMRVSISSEVVPEIREYERTSTTVANVYVQRRTERYLADMQSRLARLGFAGELRLMLSGGGSATPETAGRFPVRLLESGPAGGALAAAHYGQAARIPDLLSFDLGGTTAKFAVIAGGEPLLAAEFEVDRRYRFKKGSGLPIKTQVIEMIEIGAGGGSIARVDSLGLLRVGPDSAGADPGPAAYGQGGQEPTVTDADLVLGYLDPSFFLGGAMALDLDAAHRAIEAKVAGPLGLSLVEAAWGIHQAVNEGMAGAARVHVIERGQDPHALPMFAFGGAGPVHGYRVARALGSPRLLAPFGAGVLSTVGFLAAPPAFDFVRTWATPLEGLDVARAESLFREMEAEGVALLGEPVSHRREVDMRYLGQGHEIRVPVPAGEGWGGGLRAAFEAEYRRHYGRLGPAGVPLEITAWRVRSSGPRPDLRLDVRGEAGEARKGARQAWMPEAGGLTEVPVYDRYRLAPGARFEGPAIIEERESTLVVGPGARCQVDGGWNLVVDW